MTVLSLGSGDGLGGHVIERRQNTEVELRSVSRISKNDRVRHSFISKSTMSCEAGRGTSAPAADGLAALDDTALATLFEQLPGLGMSRELVVVVPAVSRRWRSVCRHLVSR